MDPETGALNMKKGEAWMNTVTPRRSLMFSDATRMSPAYCQGLPLNL